MRATGFDAVAAEGGNAPVEKIEAGADVGVQFVSRDVTKLVPQEPQAPIFWRG
ncbi:hypothetical protein R8871_00476 [Paraburkholderia graminis C4D1M]|jgi:electron transfer flavoprotein alpha subunit|uniref:Uncharacterized protein n=2 Tax=Paraburkholderia graminis TaxID=60548 RepID=B1G4X2_PARG4|nr:hypothetical protein BgramDRAFT_4395 [Paraburkholderia graminis C4D1M]MDQ0622818.1 hypothetical protein [Paraburkholderia graminis]MDR6207000.1 hypothetical protein [Paraburkholderia graminis]CAB3643171.1 hypothetical protein R8871_00476 [Paraburkholderia graminis C4D1M]